jgi:hypothetical protein
MTYLYCKTMIVEKVCGDENSSETVHQQVSWNTANSEFG